MKSKPDQIDVKAHKSLVRNLDYLVSHGQIYQVRVAAYGGDVYLQAVDEIPEEYSDWWETSISQEINNTVGDGDE